MVPYDEVKMSINGNGEMCDGLLVCNDLKVTSSMTGCDKDEGDLFENNIFTIELYMGAGDLVSADVCRYDEKTKQYYHERLCLEDLSLEFTARIFRPKGIPIKRGRLN